MRFAMVTLQKEVLMPLNWFTGSDIILLKIAFTFSYNVADY